MFDFRSFLDYLKKINEVEVIEEKVSLEYDIASISLNSNKTLIFKNVNNKKFQVVTNILNTRKKICLALECSSMEELHKKIIEAINTKKHVKEVNSGTVHEGIEIDSLYKLPIIKYFKEDAAPYITSAVVSTYDKKTEIENVSIHRLMLLNEKQLAIRIVPRHLYFLMKEIHKRGEAMDVAISIGVPPAVILAASCSPPLGKSEYDMAYSFNENVSVTKCRMVNARCVSNAEIVIEGRIYPGKEVDEGPFTDITGTLDRVRKQPVIDVLRIVVKEDAYYHAIVPSGNEHQLLMGIPKEASILENIIKICPNVKDVRLTPGGFHWLHAIISMKELTKGDAKNVILAAFSAHPSLKHVIIVDEETNIDDPIEIEKSIAIKFQADKNMILISGIRGSTLDPSSNEDGLTTKVGIDATGSFLREKYIKASIIMSEEAKKIINRLRNIKN
ncbi:MAG: UbiD family decarboxylase [Nitrososphaerota archaeon]